MRVASALAVEDPLGLRGCSRRGQDLFYSGPRGHLASRLRWSASRLPPLPGHRLLRECGSSPSPGMNCRPSAAARSRPLPQVDPAIAALPAVAKRRAPRCASSCSGLHPLFLGTAPHNRRGLLAPMRKQVVARDPFCTPGLPGLFNRVAVRASARCRPRLPDRTALHASTPLTTRSEKRRRSPPGPRLKRATPLAMDPHGVSYGL